MGIMRRIAIFALSTILVLSNTVATGAQSIDPAPARIVITELQTETDLNANDEFIELTNFSDGDIALDGWVVQYRSATGTSWQDKALLSGTLYVGGSIVVSTQGYNIDNSTFYWVTSGGQLASTGGNIRIIAPNSIIAEDTLAWGTGIYGEGAPSIKATKGKSLHRKSADSKFVDTNNNADDFAEDG